MSAITRVFDRLRNRKEGALIGYITAGDPTLEYTALAAEALVRGGADILELGLPFSDPIADGPTIQAASIRALNAGTKPKMVLETARKIKSKHKVPLVIMTYYNPVFSMGLEGFISYAKECLVDGLIIPDLPIEESADYVNKARVIGIDTIFLAAPSTSTKRLQKIVEYSSGFLYLVSRFGVTGETDNMGDSTIHLIKRVRTHVDGLPLAVGFGISKPEHVFRVIKAGAHGVIVGSAFVKVFERNIGKPDKIASELNQLARELKASTTYRQSWKGEP